jgi:hypothetical protein
MRVVLRVDDSGPGAPRRLRALPDTQAASLTRPSGTEPPSQPARVSPRGAPPGAELPPGGRKFVQRITQWCLVPIGKLYCERERLMWHAIAGTELGSLCAQASASQRVSAQTDSNAFFKYLHGLKPYPLVSAGACSLTTYRSAYVSPPVRYGYRKLMPTRVPYVSA